MQDERNFRSTYYEKVGCRGVEEKKSLEILLKDKPWDKTKLKQFCLRFTLPAAYRNIVWKVLLGVLPVHIDSHKFVMMQRHQQYMDILHALRAMRIINSTTPKPQIFLAMYSLESSGFQRNFEVDQSFAQITEALLEMYQDDVEVYWLGKGFYSIMQTYEKEIPKLIEHVKKLVENEDEELYQHLLDIKAFDVLPFTNWFKSCFAGVLDDCLAKIWDKICGGASKLLLAVIAAVLIITLRWSLLKAKDHEQLLKCLSIIPDQTEETIVNKAIEKWQYGANMDKRSIGDVA